MSTLDKKQNKTEEIISSEGKIVQLLNEMIEQSTMKGQSLYIEDSQLEIEPHIAHIKNGVAQVTFVLKHPIFQEDIVESVAGVGPTSDEAFKNAAIQFVASVFTVIQRALKQEDGQNVTVKLPHKENQFKLYQSELKVQGRKKTEDSIDYWALLGEELIKRLGNKRVYFIKVYVGKTEDAINCECRVNGVVYPLFAEVLKMVAANWELEGKFYSEKQIFVLIQDESTYLPYPLSKKEVEQAVLSSLLLYRECNNQEAYDELSVKMHKLCQIDSLAEELFNFIPEIFTEVIFDQVSYMDNVCLRRDEEEIEISRHQLTAYDWAYSTIERTIHAGYYEKAQVDHIIACSASLNSIRQALLEGEKLENLCNEGLCINVHKDYEVL